MPERFEIYIVYKRRYINTLPFLFFYRDSVRYSLQDKPYETAFNVVGAVVQSKNFDEFAVRVRGKHEATEVDEVLPLVA